MELLHYDEETELAAINTFLLKPELIKAYDLPQQAFKPGMHQSVYAAICDAVLNDGSADITLIARHVYEHVKEFDDLRTAQLQVAKLLDGNFASSRNIDSYVARLRNVAHRRDLVRIHAQAQQDANDMMTHPEAADERQHKAIQQSRLRWAMSPAVLEPATLITRLRTFYQTIQENAVSLGWPTLDEAIGEIYPGTVFTIIARPGIGKSNIGLNIIANWLAKSDSDWGCMFYSMEMSDTLATDRHVRIVEQWDKRELRHAMLTARQPINYEQTTRDRYVMSARGGLSMRGIEEMYENAQSTLSIPIRGVVLDYMQYIRTPRSSSRYEGVATLTAELKEFAKRREIALVLLSQVGRGEAGGQGWECPSPEAARDSGTIEENADYLLGLYRPDRDPNFDNKPALANQRGCLMLRVLKGRSGGDGRTVRLRFNEQTLRISDAAVDERDPQQRLV